jgi:hypothetical protein
VFEGCWGAYGETRLAAGGADATQGFGNIVFSLDMDVNRAGNGCESLENLSGRSIIDDIMGVPYAVAASTSGPRNVVDEVSIHDVAMNPVGSAIGFAHDLVAELGKIRRENRGGNDGFKRIHVLFDNVP